jgi:hypothetical protein
MFNYFPDFVQLGKMRNSSMSHIATRSWVVGKPEVGNSDDCYSVSDNRRLVGVVRKRRASLIQTETPAACATGSRGFRCGPSTPEYSRSRVQVKNTDNLNPVW